METQSLFGSEPSSSGLWNDDDDDAGPSQSASGSRAPPVRQRIIGLSKSRPAVRGNAVPSSNLNGSQKTASAVKGRKASQETAVTDRRPGGSIAETPARTAEKTSQGKSTKKDPSIKARRKRKSPEIEIEKNLEPFPLDMPGEEARIAARAIDEDLEYQADLRKARRAKAGEARKQDTKGVRAKDVMTPSTKSGISGKARKRASRGNQARRDSLRPAHDSPGGGRASSPDPLAMGDDDDSFGTWRASSPLLDPAVDLDSFPLSHSPVPPSSPAVSPVPSVASSGIVCQSAEASPEPFPLSPHQSTRAKDPSSPLVSRSGAAFDTSGAVRGRQCSIVDLSDSTPTKKRQEDPCSPLEDLGKRTLSLKRDTDSKPVASSPLSPARIRGQRPVKKRKSADADSDKSGVVILVSEDEDELAIAGPLTPLARRRSNITRRQAAPGSVPVTMDDSSLDNDPDAYHATWRCDYCGHFMPVHMTPDLLNRYWSLRDLSNLAKITKTDPLPWQQTLDFCSAHEAEATVVPRGIRAGYPTEIDFVRVVDRMEAPWLRQRIAAIARNPGRSKLFRRAEEDICRIGRLTWRGAEHQQTDRVRLSTRTGYYGELGRTIILQHLQRLLEWRCFPWLLPGRDDTPPVCAPMLPSDFFVHVLVPETAILLIMEDQNGTEPMPPADLAAAKAAARRLWEESAEYGVWKFREDHEEGERFIRQLLERKDEIEQMARQGRAAHLAEKSKKKQDQRGRIDRPGQRSTDAPKTRPSQELVHRQKPVPDDAIVISDTMSESGFSSTSADSVELDYIHQQEISKSPLRFDRLPARHASQDDTPRAVKLSQASSAFGDDFGEEAFVLADQAQAMHRNERR